MSGQVGGKRFGAIISPMALQMPRWRSLSVRLHSGPLGRPKWIVRVCLAPGATVSAQQPPPRFEVSAHAALGTRGGRFGAFAKVRPGVARLTGPGSSASATTEPAC
jgi:hypothetical protein